MADWVVTTDGSCTSDRAGGWAAIIEHGSDGFSLRGRVPDAMSTRMELVAAIAGLAEVPDSATVQLRVDCSTLVVCHQRWADGALANVDGPDADLWLELGQHFDRLNVHLFMLWPGMRDNVHQRAHLIARQEAKSLARGLAGNAAVEELVPAKRRLVLRHTRQCGPDGCMWYCPLRRAS